MRRVFLARWVAAAVLAATSLLGSAEAQHLPDNIRKLVFDRLRFSDPVEAAILLDDLSRGGGSSLEDSLWGGGFFIPEGYFQKVRGAPPQTYDHYVATQKLHPHMRIEKDWPSGRIKVRIAKLMLGKIDYVNQRTLTLPGSGEKAPAWSFTFTYTLDPTLPKLPRLGPFKGKATVVRDPSDGEWKTMEASMEVSLDACAGTSLWGSTCPYNALLKQSREAAIQMRTTPGSAERPESFEALLRIPGTREIPLSGLPPSPRASGRVAWHAERGGGAIMSGLPTPPPGKVYQLWAVEGSNPPVSAGVFTVDSSGSGGLSVRRLPGVTRVDAFAVTLEPAGGLPAPSGEMYLLGRADPAAVTSAPALLVLEGRWVGVFSTGFTFTWVIKADGTYEFIERNLSGQETRSRGQIVARDAQLRWVSDGRTTGTLTVQGEKGSRVIRATKDGSQVTFEARQLEPTPR